MKINVEVDLNEFFDDEDGIEGFKKLIIDHISYNVSRKITDTLVPLMEKELIRNLNPNLIEDGQTKKALAEAVRKTKIVLGIKEE
jgi:hypothetical protein